MQLCSLNLCSQLEEKEDFRVYMQIVNIDSDLKFREDDHSTVLSPPWKRRLQNTLRFKRVLEPIKRSDNDTKWAAIIVSNFVIVLCLTFQGCDCGLGERCCKFLRLFYSYRMKQGSSPPGCTRFQGLMWIKAHNDQRICTARFFLIKNLNDVSKPVSPCWKFEIIHFLQPFSGKWSVILANGILMLNNEFLLS